MEAVLEILSYVGWVLLAVMILVFVHEMGHFLFAKLFKMRVDKFSVGFPPKIIGKKIGNTEYVLGATPLGGYVKIAGMVDESMDTEFAQSVPQPWEFRSKPVWQRMVVITAGVIFNFVLAILIFATLKLAHGDVYVPAENVRAIHVADDSILYEMGLRTGDRIVAVNDKPLDRFEELDVEAMTTGSFSVTVERAGERREFDAPDGMAEGIQEAGQNFEDFHTAIGLSYMPSLIGGVLDGAPAVESGLRPGDRIVAIDSTDVRFWQEMTSIISVSEGVPLQVRWWRPDSLFEADSVPAASVVSREAGHVVMESVITPREVVSDDGTTYKGIGVREPSFALFSAEFGVVVDDLTFTESVVAGTKESYFYGRLVVTSLARVFTGKEDPRKSMGGPILIAQITKRAAAQSMSQFWRIVAILSITLGVVNILPIPALDGGHLMFLIYEGVMRREPSLKLRMALQNIGMIMLLAFMAFMIFNDILRL